MSMITPPVRVKADGLLSLRGAPPHIGIITERNARQSRLLQLPAEVRNIIYTLLVGGRHIHFGHGGSSCCRRRVVNGKHIKPKTRGFFYCSTSDAELTAMEYPETLTQAERQPAPLTPINRVCRHMYQETSLLLYSLNLFSFQGTSAMHAWLRRLLPAQQCAVRRIVIPSRGIPKVLKGLDLVYIEIPQNAYLANWRRSIVEHVQRRGYKIVLFRQVDGQIVDRYETR